jgi:hypothetical protein
MTPEEFLRLRDEQAMNIDAARLKILEARRLANECELPCNLRAATPRDVVDVGDFLRNSVKTRSRQCVNSSSGSFAAWDCIGGGVGQTSAIIRSDFVCGAIFVKTRRLNRPRYGNP